MEEYKIIIYKKKDGEWKKWAGSSVLQKEGLGFVRTIMERLAEAIVKDIEKERMLKK